MGKKVKRAVQKVGNIVENILRNPLPVIETLILTSIGFPPPVASAAVAAMNGGSMKDITNAAMGSYAGSYVGSAAGTAAAEAGAGTTLAKVAASSAGASTSTTLTSLASGKSIQEALSDGLSAAAVAGGTTGIIETGKSTLADIAAQQPSSGGGIKAVPGSGTTLLGDQTSVSGLGLTDKVPASMDSMGGASGLILNTNAILPSNLAKSPYAPPGEKVAGTDAGGLQPAYTSAADKLTPTSFDPTITGTSYKEPTTVTAAPEPPISKTTEAIAKPLISSGLSELFGLGPKVPGAPAAGGTSSVPSTAPTGITTGLTGERGAGEIESKESGKDRQNVWNEASLRLKDALGV